MRYEATINVYDDADALAELLMPELQKQDRSQVTLKKGKGHVTLIFTATDATALRACIVGFTKLFNVYEQLKNKHL